MATQQFFSYIMTRTSFVSRVLEHFLNTLHAKVHQHLHPVKIACYTILIFIHNLISPSDIVSINKLTLILTHYHSVWVQTHYDVTNKNNNISFEDLTEIVGTTSVSIFVTAVILYIITDTSLQIVIWARPTWRFKVKCIEGQGDSAANR